MLIAIGYLFITFFWTEGGGGGGAVGGWVKTDSNQLDLNWITYQYYPQQIKNKKTKNN